jgi:cytochrome b561
MQVDESVFGKAMALRLKYGMTARVFHWMIAALLLVQYMIGWLMPDIHRGMQPGAGMTFHVSFGMLILMLIVLRFFVAADASGSA